jgi:hypothetical protein
VYAPAFLLTLLIKDAKQSRPAGIPVVLKEQLLANQDEVTPVLADLCIEWLWCGA